MLRKINLFTDPDHMKQVLYTYLLNCFILFLPVMIWDMIFTNQLPDVFQEHSFWHTIPDFIYYGENISRILLFLLAFLMPFSLNTFPLKGLVFYLSGLILYFISWSLLIWFPNESWTQNLLVFMAPAYTPALWLWGIGYAGNSFYFTIPFRRWIFMSVSVIFLLFHTLHTYIIFSRFHG